MRHQYDYDIGNMKDNTLNPSADNPSEIRAVHNENKARKIEGLKKRNTYNGEKINNKKLETPPNYY